MKSILTLMSLWAMPCLLFLAGCSKPASVNLQGSRSSAFETSQQAADVEKANAALALAPNSPSNPSAQNPNQDQTSDLLQTNVLAPSLKTNLDGQWNIGYRKD